MRRWHYPVVARLIAYFFDHVRNSVVSLFTAWVRWFWRLGALAKFAAIVVQVACMYIAASWLGLGRVGFDLVRVAAVALVFFAVVSILLGGGSRRGFS